MPLPTSPDLVPSRNSAHWRNFVLMAIALALCFSVPLFELARFAVGNDLYSYILLIPFVSIYLASLKWKSLPPFSGAARKPAAIFLAGGLMMLGGYVLAIHSAVKLTEDDYLAFMMSAFVLFFAGGCCLFLGKKIARSLAFPIGFLVFMVPMPMFLLDWTESFLQYGSALAADAFFSLSGHDIFPRRPCFPVAYNQFAGGAGMQRPPFHPRAAHHQLGRRSSFFTFALEAGIFGAGGDSACPHPKRLSGICHRRTLHTHRSPND